MSAAHAVEQDSFEPVWNAAFVNAVNGAGPMLPEDYDLATRLRDNGRSPAYAAARVCLRIKNRRVLAIARR